MLENMQKEQETRTLSGIAAESDNRVQRGTAGATVDALLQFPQEPLSEQSEFERLLLSFPQ